MEPGLVGAHEIESASRLALGCRASARSLAAKLGDSCAGRRAGPRRDTSRTSAHRAIGEPAAAAAAAAGAPAGRARRARRQCSLRFPWKPSRTKRRMRRDAGQRAAERTAGCAGGIGRGARSRAGSEQGAQRLARALAGCIEFAGLDRGAAASGPRQGLGQGHPMVEGAVARRAAAPGAAAACRSRLGAGRRDRLGFISRGRLRRWLGQRGGAARQLRRRSTRDREQRRIRREQRGRGVAAGQSPGRVGLGLAVVVGVCGRDLGRGAWAAATTCAPANRW
jgi:hypothetical protein